MNSKWVETNSETGQAYLKTGDFEYYFVDTIWLDGDPDEYAAVGATVDIGGMTWRDVMCAISPYYSSIEEFLLSRSIDITDSDVDEIVDEFVATCVFETATDESCYDVFEVCPSEGDAVEAVARIKAEAERNLK